MRKADKDQADEIVRLLGQVHEGIRKMLETGQKGTVLDLLSQCQDAAIQLGETIERSEGEGFVTVTLLEEYCELVYQIYESVRQGENIPAGKTYKNLHRSLILIRNSLNQDVTIRQEAVFLPYKASMWDSLESVWKAADEDPKCDAYVIPIPYYDRNPDGSFKEEHYEGDLYPPYVPITWYKDYDFQERRPDFIFIHNPYDECNYLTSVHPYFYSKNLKLFTDQLIYIPYFILNEIDPNNQAAVDGMAHFCTTPGVLYADKTIVQSENMRQVYIKALTEFTKNTSATRSYWEEKILGLGSPKIDKVLNTRKEDVELPKEWLSIIERPDGSWKKIIFYNIGVTAILQNGEKMIAKIKDVFDVFKENKEKVALLWRPHPLVKATFQTMRPQLWAAYKELLDQYLEEGWGIYDDTPDLDRAIVVCDGYYGDPSSVVQLCQEAGKPSIIQNLNILSNKEICLSCADIVRYRDCLYILTRDTQSLFEYCLTSQKMRLCGIVAEKLGQLFVCMTLCNGKIYIAPYEADNICVYDIERKEFKRILLEASCNNLGKKHYQVCFSYQEKIYLLGSSGSAMLCLDIYKNKLEEITEWIVEFKRKFGYDAGVKTHRNVCIAKKCFWVALEGDNVLLQYNMETKEFRFWKVGNQRIQYVTVSFDGTYFWLTGDKGFIVRWDKRNKEVKEFKHFPKGFEYGNKTIEWKELFGFGHLWDNELYFMPLNCNMVVRLNTISGEMKCVKNVDEDCACFMAVEISDEELYIEEDDINNLLQINSYIIKKSGEKMLSPIRLTKENSILMFDFDKNNQSFLENHSQCLNFLFDSYIDKRMGCLHQENVGKAIWTYHTEN